MGSWIGDRLIIGGDYGEWHNEFDRYRNITANTILMLYQIDGTEMLIETAKTGNCFFLQIGYLIFTNQFPEISSEFESSFGNLWSKKYKSLLEECFYCKLYDLVKLD